MSDFREYKPRWSEPLAAEYEGYRVVTSPPPLTGGATVLGVLRVLDGVAAMSASDGRDPRYMDLAGRSLLTVYPRVTRTVADVPDAATDAREMLADASIAKLRQAAAEVEPAHLDEQTADSEASEIAPTEAADASTRILSLPTRRETSFA